MKYTLEFKLECVEKFKKGIHIDLPPGVKHRATFSHYLRSWAKAYDDLGVEGLMRKSENGAWTPEERFAIVAKVLAGGSIKSAAREAHVNSGQLCHWVRRYREKGMDGLECRRGRPQKEPIMPKKKAKLTPSEREAARPKARRRKPSGD